jgi:tetratricopeptide (TPR) repeat protein
MLLKWLDTREATEAGTALADDFVLQTAAVPKGARSKGAGPGTQGDQLQKFMQKFLQRVDREARPLQLNVFKRAKLANSFKWRLLEKGVERGIVDELTQALVLRLTANPGGAARGDRSVAAPGARSGAQNAQTLLTQGAEHLARRAYTEAMQCYQQLVTFDARNAPARNGLGIALAQLGRYGEAEDEFRRAIGIKPSLPEAHFNLAGVLQAAGRWNESEMPLRRALKLKPAYVDARVSLGMNLALLGRLREARDCYEKALRSAPRNAQALVGVGKIAALEGRFDAAESAYKSALEVDPGSSYAWAALVWLRKMTPADADWLKRAEEMVASGLVPTDESALRTAMGKYCDDVGNFARAFRNYERANELHKMGARPYDRGAHSRFVDDLVSVYTSEALSGAHPGASESLRPVFVVGMPRSGTSLVEQIIASHPAAHGAGELDFWTVLVRKHETAIRQGLPGDSLRKKLALDYTRVLDAHSREAMRVVDKAPANSDYLGLIHAVFPKARMIYLRRDPIDTCLSCYFQQFSAAMNFTMDLSDLAHYYREHQRLVAHWRRVLPPGTLLDVPYAELVADQEKWTRAILDFVGLPWDERCLDFHKTERAVTTASVWQVRQKIYKSSVGRWRNYEKFIKPLLSLSELES